MTFIFPYLNRSQKEPRSQPKEISSEQSAVHGKYRECISDMKTTSPRREKGSHEWERYFSTEAKTPGPANHKIAK